MILHLGIAPAAEFTGGSEEIADRARMLMNGSRGSFSGSEFRWISEDESRRLIAEPRAKARRMAVLTGVPSFSEDPEARVFQGIDRLIHSMLAHCGDWNLVLIVNPLSVEDIREHQHALFGLYYRLAAAGRITRQKGLQKSTSSEKHESKGNALTKTTSTGKGKTHILNAVSSIPSPSRGWTEPYSMLSN